MYYISWSHLSIVFNKLFCFKTVFRLLLPLISFVETFHSYVNLFARRFKMATIFCAALQCLWRNRWVNVIGHLVLNSSRHHSVVTAISRCAFYYIILTSTIKSNPMVFKLWLDCYSIKSITLQALKLFNNKNITCWSYLVNSLENVIFHVLSQISCLSVMTNLKWFF